MLPILRRQQSGHIVQISSIGGRAGAPDVSASMRIATLPEEYRGTVGEIAEHLRRVNGSEPIDPDKAAAAIVHITEVGDPSLRLLIGSDAAGVARRRANEDAKWDGLSRSVDFDGASTNEWQKAGTLAESYDD